MMIHGNDGIGAASSIADDRTEVWIMGDGLRQVASAAAAQACGMRIARRLTIDEALSAVAERTSGTLILIDIDTPLSLSEVRLLAVLDRQANDARRAVVVSCEQAALDDVAACVAAPFATLLCDPTPAERMMAIYAAPLPVAGVAEHDRTAEALRLLHLTDEIARIARVLADTTGEDRGSTHSVSDGLTGYRAAPSPPSQKVTAGDIRTMIRWRRRRDALIGGDYFADPVWDMMLDLSAARIEGIDVSVSSLCIAAAVPATTALRWIKGLTEAGMFVRVADPHDRRRVHIGLADDVAASVLEFLGAAKASGAMLI